jgi:hypothetical protein
MGLILRSWPLMPSPLPGGVEDGVTPSTLATADGGICRGLKASEPCTEPGCGRDRSLDRVVHKGTRPYETILNLNKGLDRGVCVG